MLETRVEAHKFYDRVLTRAKETSYGQFKAAGAYLGRHDLFFLLCRVMGRADIDHDWLYDRCRDVQYHPNNYLDLWAREHYKSTIITVAKTIQDILNDPEITIGIFSLTRPIAKGFLFAIKQECQENERLKELYPEIFYKTPEKHSKRWSLDEGIIVKREGKSKEATVEAWGLIDAMPTSRHYKIRVYDDIIDERHVGNPEIIKKSIRMWEISLSLGSAIASKAYPDSVDIARYAGTRYHANDTYRELIKRKAAKLRLYPGTANGQVDGDPVLWSKELMEKKRKEMGSYTFGCQILQDPTADQAQGFNVEDLRYWTPTNWQRMNRYLLCDPAGEKKKDNDYTVMLVIGLNDDNNYYLIDGIRDRLNLTERAKQYIKFHRTYQPNESGYEKYGKDSDIEHIEDTQRRENYRFDITPLGGSIKKNDRIRKLIPLVENHRLFVPVRLLFIDYEKKQHDLTQELIDDEMTMFPVSSHDDILDCAARIVDPELGAQFPKPDQRDPITRLRQKQPQEYDPLRREAM